MVPCIGCLSCQGLVGGQGCSKQSHENLPVSDGEGAGSECHSSPGLTRLYHHGPSPTLTGKEVEEWIFWIPQQQSLELFTAAGFP